MHSELLNQLLTDYASRLRDMLANESAHWDAYSDGMITLGELRRLQRETATLCLSLLTMRLQATPILSFSATSRSSVCFATLESAPGLTYAHTTCGTTSGGGSTCTRETYQRQDRLSGIRRYNARSDTRERQRQKCMKLQGA